MSLIIEVTRETNALLGVGLRRSARNKDIRLSNLSSHNPFLKRKEHLHTNFVLPLIA